MVVGGWWLGGRRGGRWLWLEFSGEEEGFEGEEGDGLEVLVEKEREEERRRERNCHWLL